MFRHSSSQQSTTGAADASPGLQYVMLRQRVMQEMDKAGYSSMLILLDVLLSLLSVILYIIMTYNVHVQALYIVDLSLACLFSVNWLLWLWLAEDRLHYILSFMSLVDAITIIPSFLLYALEGTASFTLPGLNFLRVLRILRVLRVFRMKHVMQRHLEGAVTEALGKLFFTLMSMLFIAAGLFYELEKYAPKPDEEYSDLMFHEALYWAAVTLTTVGYGDLHPTYWATQAMLIALLLITFTLLPYLTGQLMDALASANHYQRARFRGFSRRSDIRHVVFLGAIDDGPTMQGILDELYHEDKGFNLTHTVLLAPSPPTLDVQHLLATHYACSKLTYLQGSPFRTEDLHRAYAEYAAAVFIVAPKHAEEPLLADRHTVMMALSLGQYLQETHVRLREKLEYLPNKISQWLRVGKSSPPESLPSVYVQMVLPEGRLRLYQIMQSLSLQQKPSVAAGSSTQSGTAAPNAYTAANAFAAAAAAAVAHQGKAAEAAAAVGSGADVKVSPFLADAKAVLDAFTGGMRTTSASSHGSAAAVMCRAMIGSSSDARSAAQAGSSGSSSKRRRKKQIPTGALFWQKYLASMHVLCLGELRHALMAHSCLGVPGVITLISNLCVTNDFAVESLEKLHDLPSWLKQYMFGASQELYELAAFPSVLHGETFKTAAGFVFDTCNGVLLAVEGGKGVDKHHLTIANMEQVVEPNMRGYVIAEDMGAMVALMGATDSDFKRWQDHRLRHLQSQKAALQPPPAEAATGPAVSRPHEPSVRGSNPSRLLRQSSSLSFGSRYAAWKRGGRVPLVMHARHCTYDSYDSFNERGSSPSSRSEASHSDRQEWLFEPTQEECDAAASVQNGTAADVRPESRGEGRGAAGPAEQFAGRSGMSASAAAAASAAVAAIAGTAGSSPKDKAGHSAALAAVVHLLRSPSKQLRKYGEDFMRQHYHCRPPGAVLCPQDIVLNAVPEHLAGHTLVVGVPRSQEALMALLAPMRSRQLSVWRPIVIIDGKLPGSGSCWSLLAQFKHIYFIEVVDGLSDALSRANAEDAAQAILLSPLSANEEETEDAKLTSRVMTDAMVLNMFQLLRSLNPSMQIITELILPQNMAYLAPMTPLRNVPRQQQILLSPAFVSGCVFMTRLIDDLMLASYCNNASDRIILQLLHRWHLSSSGASLQQQLQQLKLQLEQQQGSSGSKDVSTEQQQQHGKPEQQQQQQLLQQNAGAVDVELGMLDQSEGGAEQITEQQQQQRGVRFATGLAHKAASTTAVLADTPGPATILQIPVSAAGTSYGRYFHQLLHERGLLLLGLYRRVMQDGVAFRVTITNPHYSTVLEPGDAAFVVTTLPFPASFDDSAATSAAWPPDTLGFNNLNPMPSIVASLLDPEALGRCDTNSGIMSQSEELSSAERDAEI